jgi:hypothetical protein
VGLCGVRVGLRLLHDVETVGDVMRESVLPGHLCSHASIKSRGEVGRAKWKRLCDH